MSLAVRKLCRQQSNNAVCSQTATEINNMKKVASLHYDVIFKKAFCDLEIFTAFAQDMLGLKLEIDHVETEKRFDVPLGRITPRFDLFAEDKKNRIIVDIQHARYADHYDRFLYYHCSALIEQALTASDYRPPRQVFTIVVLTSGDKYKTDIAITDFAPRKLDGTPLLVFQHKILFLCPKYADDATPAPYHDWLRAINDSLDGEVEETQYDNFAIQKIFTHIEDDQISPDDRARMKDEYSDELLLQTKIGKAIKQQKREMARQGLEMGLEVAMIVQLTGLTEEQVSNLPQMIDDGEE